MKIAKNDPRHWLILLRQGLYSLLAIGARYMCRKPRKPIAVLYGHQLSGNLKALYDHWQQSSRDQLDCYFLTLDPAYSKLLEGRGIKVLHCGSLTDMLTVGRCSVMVTDHGLHAMRPFISLTNIRFVDVWHGIPFKGFVPDDFRIQHGYDEVWVSSPLLKRIYEEDYGFESKNVFDMGYARTDKLFRNDTPVESYRKQALVPANRKLVLYAPTWQQDDKGHELFPFGENQNSFIKALSEVCTNSSATLVIRSHLNAHISEQVFNNVLYCSMKEFPDTECLLQETDVLICDWSSIAFDYLALNRPAIFLDVKPPYKNGLSLGPEYRYGEVVNSMASLTENLHAILQDSTGYHAQQASKHADITKQVYGENTDGGAAQRQLHRLIDMVDSKFQ